MEDLEFEQRVRDIAQSMLDENQTIDQFAVSQTPFHTHNGSDSPRVAYSDLTGKTIELSHVLFGTQAATAGNYSVFFIAPYALTLASVSEAHTTAGSDGGAVTLQIEKLTGTTAPGSGTSLLASAFNLKSTANTVVSGTFVTTPGAIQFASGDRCALLLSGTPTSLANVAVTCVFTLI